MGLKGCEGYDARTAGFWNGKSEGAEQIEVWMSIGYVIVCIGDGERLMRTAQDAE
jgi:hypothetical protein